jgi:hypothetical protein
MKKLLLILLLPIYANSQTLTIAQLTTRLVAAEANITAINTKLSGIYTTLDSYKAQLVGLSARTTILEVIPKDTIKVVEGLTLSNKTIGLDTVYADKRYTTSSLQLAIYFAELKNKTSALSYTIDSLKTNTVLTFNGAPISKELNFLNKQYANKVVEGKLEDVIGRVIILETFRAALKNL